MLGRGSRARVTNGELGRHPSRRLISCTALALHRRARALLSPHDAHPRMWRRQKVRCSLNWPDDDGVSRKLCVGGRLCATCKADLEPLPFIRPRGPATSPPTSTISITHLALQTHHHSTHTYIHTQKHTSSKQAWHHQLSLRAHRRATSHRRAAATALTSRRPHKHRPSLCQRISSEYRVLWMC